MKTPIDDKATCLIRDLTHVLRTEYGVSRADAQDLLDRIKAWAEDRLVDRRREMLRVIEGGKQ